MIAAALTDLAAKRPIDEGGVGKHQRQEQKHAYQAENLRLSGTAAASQKVTLGGTR